VIASLRNAFTAEHGLQCGYCTPAMLITARDIVMRLPEADEARIRLELSGNLCRCTGYVGIVAAIRRVLAERAGAAAQVPKRALGPVGSGRAAGAAAPPVRMAAANAAVDPAHRGPSFTELGLGAKAPNFEVRDAFVIARPPDEVWANMQNIEQVAPCMPGVTVTNSAGDRVEGRIAVKLGPMTAAFNGAARVSFDEALRRGTIAGSGQDRLTGSRTAADVEFAVVPGDDAQSTRVDILVRAHLSGPLAQFSRAGIVEDVARRLTRTFAQNLEQQLSGGAVVHDAGAESTPLKLGSLLLSAWRARLQALLSRLFGRKKS
jgi:carbon-monoxide dehydrogenase small subunit